MLLARLVDGAAAKQYIHFVRNAFLFRVANMLCIVSNSAYVIASPAYGLVIDCTSSSFKLCPKDLAHEKFNIRHYHTCILLFCIH